MKSLMVQGTSSGAGKSILVTALCRIFSDCGLSVAPFKSQNMSRLSYSWDGLEISRAQAVQALAARTDITPDINPILLKPEGDNYSAVYLNGRYRSRMNAKEYYAGFATGTGIRAALRSLRRLQKGHDIVVIEGAGSPAEINMQKFDIANMAIAQEARSPVVLVTDIERGGSFASLAGTLLLLSKRHQRLVRGFVFNKFRGDAEILEPGLAKIRRITGKKTFGVIPKVDVGIPSEDSLDGKGGRFVWNARKLDSEIDKISGIVKKSLDMGALEEIIR